MIDGWIDFERYGVQTMKLIVILSMNKERCRGFLSVNEKL